MEFAENLNLNFQQFNWVFNNRNSEELNDIKNYLNEEIIPFNPEIQNFVKEAINALIDGGSVDYEEQLIISSSVPDCVKNIISKMTESNVYISLIDLPDFIKQELNLSGYILNIFNNSNNYHLTFKVAALSPNSQGIERNASTRYNTSTKSFEITLNTSYVTNATDLAIARTIIHESLHAYFSLIYYTQPFSELRDSLSNLLAQNGNNPNTAQHILMTQNFIDKIANSLANWDNNSLSDRNYYNYLSWSGGMLNTPAYSGLPETYKQNIINANIAEGNAGQNGLYTQNAFGNKNCN